MLLLFGWYKLQVPSWTDLHLSRLIMMALTSGDISIYLIIGNVQKVTKWFSGVEMMFTLQVEICFIVPNSQIIKRNK